MYFFKVFLEVGQENMKIFHMHCAYLFKIAAVEMRAKTVGPGQ